MVRTPALVRQWNILRVLSEHREGLSIEEMAARTAVNTRTIRRDLRVFLDAGIPLRETIGRRNKKTWRVERERTPVLESYSTEEYLALSLTERLFEPIRQTGFFEALSRCRARAARGMGESARARIEKLVEGLSLLANEDGVRTFGARLAETYREVTNPNCSMRFSSLTTEVDESHQARANP